MNKPIMNPAAVNPRKKLQIKNAFIIALASSNFITSLSAKPYRLIMSSKPSCAQTSTIPGVRYGIDYLAPDLDLSNDGDMILTVHHTLEHSVSVPFYSQAIVSKEGVLSFESAHHPEVMDEGFLDICVKAVMATHQKPRRISFSLHEMMDIPEFKAPDQSHVVDRLARMEYEVEKMTMEVENVMVAAEMTHDHAKHLHRQNRMMHRASKWWPIVQIIILCGATILQAKYMMNYLSKRHVL